MPPHKDTLDESDRWRIIHYLRALLATPRPFPFNMT